MRSKLLFTFCFIIISYFSIAQTYTQTIRGKVIDKDSKTPIPGANIILTNSDTLIGNTTDADGQRRNSFKAWWMGLMINQERNIREKMTLFWHNHFSTESNDMGSANWDYKTNVNVIGFFLPI